MGFLLGNSLLWCSTVTTGLLMPPKAVTPGFTQGVVQAGNVLSYHRCSVLAPQHLEPAPGNQFLSGRHIIAQEGFRYRFELTGVVYVHAYRQFFQGLAEVVVIAAETLDADAAEGIDDNGVGEARQQELVLVVTIATTGFPVALKASSAVAPSWVLLIPTCPSSSSSITRELMVGSSLANSMASITSRSSTS